jgi:hypothetical protein
MANKPVHRSKTMWFGLLVMCLGFIYDNFSYLQNVIDPKNYGWLLMGIGLLVNILRYFSKDSIR